MPDVNAWGNDLVCKVGGKMFAVAATEPDDQERIRSATPAKRSSNGSKVR